MFITTPLDVTPNEVVIASADHTVTIVKTDQAQTMIERLHKHRPQLQAELNAKRYLTVLPDDIAIKKQAYLFNKDFGISAETAWNKTKGNRTVVVAVLDSGIDLTHPDLAANLWKNTNELPNNGVDDDDNGYVDDTVGWDFVDEDTTPQPNVGVGPSLIANHGTHVAGIIGAVGNNTIGGSGVVWHVQLMPLRVFAADGSSDIAHITRAIYYAKANGADIINMSYVGTDPSTIEQTALEEAHAAGIINIAAAGNRSSDDEGNLNETPLYPVCYVHVLGVAALNQRNELARFSNYGQACVDVATPGKNIYSTVVDGAFAYLSGTSMAAPQVSGAAALLLSNNSGLTPAQIRKAVTETATPLSNPLLGAGKLNVSAALTNSWESSTVPHPPQITARCLKRRRHCVIQRGEANNHHRPYFTWKIPFKKRPIVGYYIAWGDTRKDPVQTGQLQTATYWQPQRLPDQTAHYYLVVRALNDRGEISPRAVFDYHFVPHLRDP